VDDAKQHIPDNRRAGLTSGGSVDAFVSKVRADGTALVYSGLVGGSGQDEANGIAIDSAGNAYIAGFTNSAEDSFPVTVGPDLTIGRNASGGPTSDAFVAKIDNVDPVIDLSLTMVGSPEPVIVGNVVTYTITVANAGPSPATSVVLSDTLPSGFAFKSHVSSQGTCIGTATTICTIGTLLSGASVTVTIEATPPQVGSFSNTASVTGLPSDNPSNNSATAITTVSGVPTVTPTPTLTPTATSTTVPTACSPRPNLGVSVVPNGPGTLRVTITAGTQPATPNNTLHSARSLPTTTGLVDIPGGATNLTGAFTLPVPSRARQIAFDVRPSGQGGTVLLEVVDDCGPWPTLVGGGQNAFNPQTAGAQSLPASQTTPTPTATPAHRP